MCRPGGTKGKETHLFDTWPLPVDPHAVLEQYLSLFACDSSELQNVTLLDSTPSYLYTAAAPGRIRATLPDAKFVVILRVRTHSLAVML